MLTYIKNYIITLRYIKLLAYHSAKYLQQSRQDSHQHRYTYYYGFQIIYGAINKGLLLILLGLLFNILPQLLLVTITFVSLRVFAGGLHFDSYQKCAYASFISFVIAGLLTKYINTNLTSTIIIFSAVFTLFILYAPVEHPNRPLKQNEKIKFKQTSIAILLILFLLYLNSNSIMFSNAITYGVGLAGLITIPCISRIK